MYLHNLINYMGVMVCALILGACGGSGGGTDPISNTDEAPPVPVWQGIKQLGSDTSEVATSVASNGQGNVYVTGWTTGDLDGNTNAGMKDVFLAKYDAVGNKLWTRQTGSINIDEAAAVAIDSLGNIYITGTTYADLAGVDTHQGGADIFIAKYDATGELMNIWQFGTPQNDQAFDILIDSNDSLYVTGRTYGDLAGPGSLISLSDYFIAKLDSDGNQLWLEQGSYDFVYCPFYCSTIEAQDIGNALALDPDGNINIAVTSFSLGQNGHIATYQPDGTFNGDISVALSNDISIDSTGAIYVTGQFAPSPGMYDIGIIKYQSDGTQVWFKQLASSENENVLGIANDTANYVHITGYTRGSFDGLENTIGFDMFAARFDSEGNHMWTKQLGGDGTNEIGRAITIDTTGHLIIAGETESNLGDNINAGEKDLFVLKYDTDGNLL